MSNVSLLIVRHSKLDLESMKGIPHQVRDDVPRVR